MIDRVVLGDGLRVRGHEFRDADAFQGPILDERADDVRAGDDSEEALPLHDRDRTEPGRDHLLRRLGKRRLRSDFWRFLEDRRYFRVWWAVASAHGPAYW